MGVNIIRACLHNVRLPVMAAQVVMRQPFGARVCRSEFRLRLPNALKSYQWLLCCFSLTNHCITNITELTKTTDNYIQCLKNVSKNCR